MALGTVDYIIFGFSVLMSTVISFYYRFTGGKQKSNQVKELHPHYMTLFNKRKELRFQFYSFLGISTRK